jgi:hypothetical protein
MSVEGASSFRELIRSGKIAQLADPLGQINGYINEQIGAADYVRALQIREIIQQKMTDLFENFDILVAASQPIAASPLEANLETDLTFPDPLGGVGNLCGLPALSVPADSPTSSFRSACNSSANLAATLAVIQRRPYLSAGIPTGTANTPNFRNSVSPWCENRRTRKNAAKP